MTDRKNVLWIMADQLRWDYLSCYGHKYLKTPNIDWLASQGVLFNRAYVQSPICGPSRMSSYTGRYVRSHGSTWNGFPLRVGEPTIGSHLRRYGIRSALVGKTHMVADTNGMERLGIGLDTDLGILESECGFEPFERDDGLHPDGPYDPNPRYNEYLREQGLKADNPWEDFANSGYDENGVLRSGWYLRYSNLPANIPEHLSETPYMIGRAMDFMEASKDEPWFCHLSLIKPHWPYIVPAPYHDMYGPEHIQDVVRSEEEKLDPHPVYKAFMESRICQTFARPGVREVVIPAYMGLIKQIDDHLGQLFEYMKDRKLFENTMIVFSSDHGDYLGDHWMGDKDLFHEQSVRIPLIVFDPSQSADRTRGTVCDKLVESIDIAPTILDYFGGESVPHIMEGRSLSSIIRGTLGKKEGVVDEWRQYAFSEYDYSTREARFALGVQQEDARLIMIADDRWKYIYAEGFRPILYDMKNDPHEFRDLGGIDTQELDVVRQRFKDALVSWATKHHNRITMATEKPMRRPMPGCSPAGT